MQIQDVPDEILAQGIKKYFGHLDLTELVAFTQMLTELTIFLGHKTKVDNKTTLEKQLDSQPGHRETVKKELNEEYQKLGKDEFLQQLSKQYGVPILDIANLNPNPSTLKVIPADIARKHTIFPIKISNDELFIALFDPSDIFTIDDIQFLTGYKIKVAIATKDDIENAIEKYYPKTPK